VHSAHAAHAREWAQCVLRKIFALLFGALSGGRQRVGLEGGAVAHRVHALHARRLHVQVLVDQQSARPGPTNHHRQPRRPARESHRLRYLSLGNGRPLMNGIGDRPVDLELG
jgi:hypothetical protein